MNSCRERNPKTTRVGPKVGAPKARWVVDDQLGRDGTTWRQDFILLLNLFI